MSVSFDLGGINGAEINAYEIAGAPLGVVSIFMMSSWLDEEIFMLLISGKLTAKETACSRGDAGVRLPRGVKYVPVCDKVKP